MTDDAVSQPVWIIIADQFWMQRSYRHILPHSSWHCPAELKKHSTNSFPRCYVELLCSLLTSMEKDSSENALQTCTESQSSIASADLFSHALVTARPPWQQWYNCGPPAPSDGTRPPRVRTPRKGTGPEPSHCTDVVISLQIKHNNKINSFHQSSQL